MTASFLSDKFEWIHNPLKWMADTNTGDQHHIIGETEGTGGSFEISDKVMKIKPPAYKDFWARTYYSPTLLKSDACGYLFPIAAEEEATIKVDFSYTPVLQFDQAGLLLYIDEDHWVKCGIEFCDGRPRLSVVVCNVYSDWSTQPWSGFSARLKVHKVNQGSSLVVEAAEMGSEDYQFVRIAHISGPTVTTLSAGGSELSLPNWRVGPFAACPTKQKGCEATFQNFSVGQREKPVHNPDLASHDL
jgi:regulation of enolase protein 1 (concanavalin A-like superfamily)